MKINIIGDIAGRYDELQLLLKKMPEADLILSVGDMIDRGPKSREVLEFFMNTPGTEAIYGNHEDMMVQAVRDKWQVHLWLHNGGSATVKQFMEPDGNILVPVEMIAWLEKRPMYFKTDDLIVSHAPIHYDQDDIPSDPYSRDHYFIWNRWVPYKRTGDRFMIFGHNGKLEEYGDYAMCVDNSHRGELVGIHWPTKEIFRQEYLPEGEVSQKVEEAVSKAES